MQGELVDDKKIIENNVTSTALWILSTINKNVTYVT